MAETWDEAKDRLARILTLTETPRHVFVPLVVNADDSVSVVPLARMECRDVDCPSWRGQFDRMGGEQRTFARHYHERPTEVMHG